MEKLEEDLDIWSMLNKAYEVKRRIIKDISRYNKKWDIKRKALAISSCNSKAKKRILRQQRKDILKLSIKTIKTLEELKRLRERLKARIRELKLEIAVIKVFIEDFRKAELHLPKESAESLLLSQRLLALKVREINSYERVLDSLERFAKHLNEKTLEHVKNENSIIREQIERIEKENEDYLLLPEANNRSKMIISLFNLKTMNDEHKSIRKVVKYEVITRDKNLVSLAKLFFNYKRKEPLSFKLLNSLNEKVYKKAA